MKTSFDLRCIGMAAAVLLFAAQPAAADVLYDPATNTLPSAQSWLTLGTPGYTQSVGGGAYTLNTTLVNDVKAGSSLFNLTALDSVAGFKLDFNLRIASEAHSSTDRAGFSLIVTGADPAQALELGFWGDRVFAYTATFARGSEALFATSLATDYSLVVRNNQYTFSGGGAKLLSGALVDYSAKGSPYTLPGFLFFGDDTTRAQSLTEMGVVTLAAVPEPATGGLLLAGLAGLAFVRRLGVSGAFRGAR